MKLLKKLFPNKAAKERKAIEVSITEDNFQVTIPGLTSQTFLWSDIREIRAIIEKDEDGDPFMVISVRLDDNAVIVPRGCKGYKLFKSRIFKLTDFAASSYNQALECNDIQQFILWRRKVNRDTPGKSLKSQKSA